MERNENENTTFRNFWDAAKVAQKGMIIAVQAYLKKQGKFQISNLILHLQELEKQSSKLVQGRK